MNEIRVLICKFMQCVARQLNVIFCNLGTGVDIVKDFKTRFDYNRMDINGLRDEIGG